MGNNGMEVGGEKIKRRKNITKEKKRQRKNYDKPKWRETERTSLDD